MSIEEDLIRSLGYKLLHYSKRKSAYKFQCPYCQYGRRSSKGKPFTPSEASGYLYQGANGWNFKCHRKKHCGLGMSFTDFLEENFPNEFLNYVRLREEHGTTGHQTNCPSLATALQRRGSLPTHLPRFHDPCCLQNTSEPPSEASVGSFDDGVQQKVTKLPPMRSPQQQAGHQAKISKQVKDYRQRRNREPGDFYL